jgi:hypothetical protein
VFKLDTSRLNSTHYSRRGYPRTSNMLFSLVIRNNLAIARINSSAVKVAYLSLVYIGGIILFEVIKILSRISFVSFN